MTSVQAQVLGVVLLLCTWVWAAVNPLEIEQPPLASIEDFSPRTYGGGVVVVSPSGVRLTTPEFCEGECRALLTVKLGEETNVVTTVHYEALSTGDRSRLIAVSRAAEEKNQWFGGDHLVRGVSASTLFADKLAPSREVEVGVLAIGPGVDLLITEITTSRAERRTWHSVGRYLILAMWAGWVLALLYSFRRRLKTPLVVLGVLTAVGMTTPRWAPTSLLWLLTYEPTPHLPVALLLQKGLGHFGAFWLACVLLAVVAKVPLLRVFTLALSFAVITESVQQLRPGRSGSLTDVGIDLLGASAALMMVFLINQWSVFRSTHRGS